MRLKETITSEPILDLFKQRWSTRSFDINKPIERHKIISMCEAARWVPTCANEQPFKFIIWDKFKDEESYHKAFTCLDDRNQMWVKTAPVIVATFAHLKYKKSGTFNDWAQYDTGTATMAFYTQAISMGIMTHPMAGFDAKKVIELFNIPEDYKPMSMIAVGYQYEDYKILDESFYYGETAPRSRVPLGENFFDSEFGTPILPQK